MIKIELIYDFDCPNVDKARANLKKALENLPIDKKWIEWERAELTAPTYVQRYGSPTVLIDGNSIAKDGVNEEGSSCRIYLDEHGKISHIPSVNQIRTAIQVAIQKQKTWPLIVILSSVGSGILALVPAISCPLCWPAYTSLLSVLGIGFFNYTHYLAPLLICLIGFVGFLLWRNYRLHQQILPFLLALIGGILAMIAKFIYPNYTMMYVGIACLVIASIVNIFYVKKIIKELSQPCDDCYQ